MKNWQLRAGGGAAAVVVPARCGAGGGDWDWSVVTLHINSPLVQLQQNLGLGVLAVRLGLQRLLVFTEHEVKLFTRPTHEELCTPGRHVGCDCDCIPALL